MIAQPWVRLQTRPAVVPVSSSVEAQQAMVRTQDETQDTATDGEIQEPGSIQGILAKTEVAEQAAGPV